MNYEDFIRPKNTDEETAVVQDSVLNEADQTEEELSTEINLDIQKAVVESLAADKAEQDLEINKLRKENYKLKTEIIDLKAKIDEMRTQLLNVGDILSRNSEKPMSNQVTLLERSENLQDRFEGETRDHVIEILKEARDAAERDGRNRRSQLLEAVLVANESNGILAKKREQLEKIFADNQNIINGKVINELDKLGIPYKVGEKYLLAKEIVKREY